MANRLGMGGGYYDRPSDPWINYQCRPTYWPAHDCQLSEALPLQSWDIPLSSIILLPVKLFYVIKIFLHALMSYILLYIFEIN